MNSNSFYAKLKEAWIMFRVFCGLKMDALRLDVAIFMANALQRARNKRFYVVENAKGKLIWICNEDIKLMKRPRTVRHIINGKLRTFKVTMLPKNISHLDIMEKCLYYTPISRNNSNGITVEERNRRQANWLRYMETIRLNRMFGKLKVKK